MTFVAGSSDEGEGPQISFSAYEEAMMSVAGRMEDQSNQVVLFGFILLFFWKWQKIFRDTYYIWLLSVHEDKSSQLIIFCINDNEKYLKQMLKALHRYWWRRIKKLGRTWKTWLWKSQNQRPGQFFWAWKFSRLEIERNRTEGEDRKAWKQQIAGPSF